MLQLDIGSSLVDPSGCVTCCCEVVSIKPGETLPLYLNYAPWAVPFAKRGLHCVPSVEIEEKRTCDVANSSNMPPEIYAMDGMARFDTGTNVILNANLGDKVSDPDGDPIVYKLLPHYRPQHGKLQLDPNGPFTYNPSVDFKGEERFYVTASDGINAPFIFEVLIAVGIDAGLMKPKLALEIGTPIVNAHLYIVTVPLIASPAAQTCQVFRLTIRQGALDCECNCYYHTDCVDVRIVKC